MNGKTYMLNGKNGALYAGQTTQPLSRRMSQHKNNKKMSNKMFLYAEEHGMDSLSVLYSQSMNETELNAAEERLITENKCIENGLNTNHAPKKRTRNDFTRLLHRYCGRYTLGDHNKYRLSDIMKWAKKISVQGNQDFDFASFVGFIATGYAHDTFYVDLVGAGSGYYTKKSASTIQKLLMETPEMAQNVMLYTNRFFFNTTEEKKILTKLNRTSKELQTALNRHNALDRAWNSLDVAKWLSSKHTALIKEKTKLERKVKSVAIAL